MTVPGGPNAQVRAYLEDYLSRKRPDFAVLLSAPWGAGKTHLIRDAVASLTPKPLLVSLFGVKDEQGAHYAIARALLGGETAEKNTKAWNTLAGPFKKLTGLDLHTSLTDIARFFPLPDTIILDDLERSGMDEDTLLGLINGFVERDGKKVILLAYEDRLWTDSRKKKEKVVGQTLRVTADIDAALPFSSKSFPSRRETSPGMNKRRSGTSLSRLIITTSDRCVRLCSIFTAYFLRSRMS